MFSFFLFEGALFRLPYQGAEGEYARKYRIKALSSLAFALFVIPVEGIEFHI